MEHFNEAHLIARYIIKYLKDELTDEERSKLEDWIAADEKNRLLFDELKDEARLQEPLKWMKDVDTSAAWDLIKPKIAAPTKVIPIGPSRTWRWRAVAIAILLLAGISVVYKFFYQNSSQNNTNANQQVMADLPPGGNKAVLTLANGNRIILDSIKTGALARQGNTTIVKLDGGKLAYQPSSNSTPSALQAPVEYNTLSTPRGGQYQLTLPDGSQVWLNAASSIRYPTVFAGNERRVEITGEAYFEVTHHATMPFKVVIKRSTGNAAEVDVLGTHFDINAYDDEPDIKTTLIEGSVRMTEAESSMTISAGQQIVAAQNGSMQLVKEADIDKSIAWKNGKFVFSYDDMGSIMKQLSRWYDIDVHFEGNVSDHYSGRISRQVNISQVLKMLEAAGGVSFTIKDKEIKIFPKSI